MDVDGIGVHLGSFVDFSLASKLEVMGVFYIYQFYQQSKTIIMMMIGCVFAHQ